jgi:hypothetical protein
MWTNTTVDLKIDYEIEKSKIDNLMEFSIGKNTQIEFCVGDFIHSIQDKFNIILSITDVHGSKWIESTFTLKKIIASLQPRNKDLLHLIKNWDTLDKAKPKEYPLARKEFFGYPTKSFNESYDDGEKYSIKFTGKFNHKV